MISGVCAMSKTIGCTHNATSPGNMRSLRLRRFYDSKTVRVANLLGCVSICF